MTGRGVHEHSVETNPKPNPSECNNKKQRAEYAANSCKAEQAYLVAATTKHCARMLVRTHVGKVFYKGRTGSPSRRRGAE